MKTWILFIGTSIALTACGSNAQRDSENANKVEAAAENMPGETAQAERTERLNLPLGNAGYLAMAGAGDLWEIESSKALLAKSDTTDVKRFADMMIEHHTASTEKLAAAARSANLTVSQPKLDADQQRMLNEIENADKSSIDAVYVRNQKLAHEKALALHQGYGQGGDTEVLKKAANEIIPVVQRHLEELGSISQSMSK
jgi:putative membrane protein